MRQNVADTSIAAYRAMPVKQLATQADRIYKIVYLETFQFLLDGMSGVARRDMSLKEIQRWYRASYGEIDLSTVSARVNALVAAKRLERLETTRKCSISGINIHPVRIPS
jgi:hypothetical protein